MANIKTEWVASSALTIGLASLASDTNLLAGRQSTAVDNTTNKALDFIVGGKITTGTSPTAGVIEVWVYASLNDTPLYPDAITGTDGNVTILTTAIKAACLRPLAFLQTDANSSRTYWIAPTPLSAIIGSVMPKFWGLFVVHNGVVVLHATADNHAFYAVPVFATVA